MNKVKINMVAGGFQHDICSSAGSVPKYIEWDKGGHTANISIHIDNGINIPTDKKKRNYAWVSESSAIVPNVLEWIRDNISYVEENFELIFTHDKRLLPLSDKIRLVIPNAVPWVTDRKVHEKNKLISMIASTKNYAVGHRHRQLTLRKYASQMDCFGRGYNYINKKEIGLNDYCFSIAVLNDNVPNYFTEIVTDCFATGTIPIYWGTPAIGEFFNMDGIINLTDNFKVEDLSMDLYYTKIEYVLDNFERVINLPIAEDYIYDNFIK